jgi:hypothetical protein
LQKQRKNNNPSTHIHDHWLGTCTSINNGGVNLVLWAQTSPLSERMWICKWFPRPRELLSLICSCCKESLIWYTVYFILFCVCNVNLQQYFHNIVLSLPLDHCTHRGSQLYFHITRYVLKRRREDTFWGAKSESRVSAPLFAPKTV